MPRKIASVKNANPSSENGMPMIGPANSMNRGHRSPSSNDSTVPDTAPRSEEHTSELQSLAYLVCRLLLEKKKQNHRSFAPRRGTSGRGTRACATLPPASTAPLLDAGK